MSTAIRKIGNQDLPAWDAFVEAAQGASFYHRAGWKTILEDVFNYRTHYLVHETDGVLSGILPLAEIKSVLFGHTLVSTPLCMSGGALVSSEIAHSELMSYACELADELQVDSLEVRGVPQIDPAWQQKDMYTLFRKSIDADNENNLKAIPRKQRAVVRKALNNGLISEATDDVDRAFDIYAESVRNLGTPVFPRKLFHKLKEVFDSDCRMLMIQSEGRDVAGVLSFYFKNEVLPHFGGGTTAARSLGGNDFMYWELMRRSADEGVEIFDFGRSKAGTGSYSFKKNWGFVPTELPYAYFLVRADQIPQVNPLNPKYQLFINTWKKLPLPIANRVGPLLSRSLS